MPALAAVRISGACTMLSQLTNAMGMGIPFHLAPGQPDGAQELLLFVDSILVGVHFSELCPSMDV